MPGFIPVPWVQWRRFRVRGVVRELESGRPLEGLMVCAFDEDLVRDDYLGECSTDAEGRFEIRFTDADFKDVLETRPDVYLSVFVTGEREPVHDTRAAIRHDAGDDEYFEIEIPRGALPGSA